MDGSGTGIEAVDDRFDLGGKTVIIQRRHQGNHIAVHQLLDQFCRNGILNDTGAVHPAGIAAPAGVDVFKGSIEAEYFMSRRLCPFNELIRQQGRSAGLMRTAAKNYDFHFLSVRHAAGFCFRAACRRRRAGFLVPADRIDAAAAEEQSQSPRAGYFQEFSSVHV